MEAIKKVDNYKRVRIPVDMQNELGWKIGDSIKVEVQDNKIIMTKLENDSEDNLVTHEDTPDKTIIEPQLPTLNSQIKVKQPEIKLLDENQEDETLDELRCHQCGRKIGKSRFIINHGYVCRTCRNDLRDRLIADIKKNKALRKDDTE